MKHSIDKLLDAVANAVWMITPQKLQTILSVLDSRAQNGPVIELRAGDSETESPSYTVVDGVGILPLQGTISQKQNIMTTESGGTSSEIFGMEFDELLGNPDVHTILIDIDSPGGTASGMPELAAKIYAARSEKRIVAHANTFAASGAYYVASQAHEIIASPSAELGSIGVVGVHTEYSEMDKKIGVKNTIIKIGEHKAEGNSYEPLTKEARADIEERFTVHYDMFVAAVARGRNATIEHVEQHYGQGKVFTAEKAVAIGMADSIGTFEETLSALKSERGKIRSMKMAEKKIETVDGRQFLEAFGDQGGVWYAEGKTFDEARDLYQAQMKEQNEKLTAQVAEMTEAAKAAAETVAQLETQAKDSTAKVAELEKANAELTAAKASADQKVAELADRIEKANLGESTPATFQAAEEDKPDPRQAALTGALGENLGKFAAGIKLPKAK